MAEEKGIFAENSGNSFETPEPGSYIARCYKMIDMGTLPQTFEGKPSKPARKVLMYFELLEDEDDVAVRMDTGQPFSVRSEYTLSTNAKANLRKDIDAWRGVALTEEEAERFNVTKLLGKFCRLNIIVNEKGYANIKGVSATKKRPEPVNDESWWSVTNPDMEAYREFPEWLQTKIAMSAEFAGQGTEDPDGPVEEQAKDPLDDLQF